VRCSEIEAVESSRVLGCRTTGCPGDPLTLTLTQVAPRDIPLETVLRGMQRAFAECAASHGIFAGAIVTLIKSDPLPLSASILDAAIALRHLGVVKAIGFAAAEIGYPHSAFAGLAAAAKAAGLRVVSHAGEEGPPSYVSDAVWGMGAERIDHGVRSIEDPALCSRLAAEGVGLCVCPLSNYRLQVYSRFFGGTNPVGRLLRAGLRICISSGTMGEQTRRGHLRSRCAWHALYSAPLSRR
jgi:adenosine deaminase